jgi:hypothetical protein
MGQRKPYGDRSDLERLVSSWTKHLGFMARDEWSAAITRAATAAEIAANIAVRSELETQRNLEKAFVDSLLKWANGLDGKLTKLLIPLPMSKANKDVINNLKKLADRINKRRNAVVHSGNFMNEKEAAEIQNYAREFVNSIIGIYHQGYSIDDESTAHKKSSKAAE